MKWAYILVLSILILEPGTSYGFSDLVVKPNYYTDDIVRTKAICGDEITGGACFVQLYEQNGNIFTTFGSVAKGTVLQLDDQPSSSFFSFGTVYIMGLIDDDIPDSGANLFTLPADKVLKLKPVRFLGDLPTVWGSSGVFGTTTNLASVVSSGVQETGVSMWPLLIFLGTAMAFVIAIKVQNFVMGSVDVNKPISPTGRNGKRTGSYKAFKKGKSELPGLWDK